MEPVSTTVSGIAHVLVGAALLAGSGVAAAAVGLAYQTGIGWLGL